ncbi:hypothetical protein [Clostridium tagluense]|uniref:Uncharacterized protein n=1 Tax=Clostridium tagluense TaxID=360422 RepID=A0A401ULM7_9CLOT|nr:hypothetical protein [Clostridium tagluense]GCD10434.1 hypothetical protein Ctaglu_20570 [Clostridium tagluense]
MAIANNYGMIILSKVKSVYNGNIFSVVSADALQNGQIGHLGALKAGEREIRSLVKPTAESIKTKGMVLIAHDEIIYDETNRTSGALQNFICEANVPARAYEISPHDSFEVSKVGITPITVGTGVVVGNYVVGTVGGYGFTEVATLPLVTEAMFVAEITGKRTVGIATNVGQNGMISGAVDYVELEVLRNNY